MQYILAKLLVVALQACPSLKRKRVTPDVLRHTSAMALLQAGVDTSLGHESVETSWRRPHHMAAVPVLTAPTIRCWPS
jgi:integrase